MASQRKAWREPTIRHGASPSGTGVESSERANAQQSFLLPLHVPPRRPGHEPSRIPRTIWQSWVDRNASSAMFKAVSTWIDLNPAYEYRFFDDAAVAAFVRGFDCSDLDFDADSLHAAFAKIRPQAAKADLFRYLLLYRHGGVWADIDTVCRSPISDYLEPDLDAFLIFTRLAEFRVFAQHVLYCAPKHPFMKAAAEACVRDILAEVFHRGLRHVFTLTGPVALTCAINRTLGNPEEFEGYTTGVQRLGGCRVRIEGERRLSSAVQAHYAGYNEDRAARGLRKAYHIPIFNPAAPSH